MGRRPRVAWFCPLPPAPTAAAETSQELLPLLMSSWEVDVYVDARGTSMVSSRDRLRVRVHRDFAREDRRAPYDAVVYHLANHPAHAYAYQAALKRPGMLVLHDTSLHDLVLDTFLRRYRFRDYRELLRARYGPLGEATAELVRYGQRPSHLVSLPLTEDVIARAQLVIVHNDVSRQAVLTQCPEVSLVCVPLGVRPPPRIDRRAARRRLGLRDDVFILSAVAPASRFSRLEVVMRALRALRRRRAAMMVLAGRVDEGLALDHLADLHGVGEAVECWGIVGDNQARLLNAAADVCLHLRYPTSGDTSVSLLRAMGAARATLVSEAGAAAELPAGVVAKVPVDTIEDETVVALLEALADNERLKDALGENARAYVQTGHHLGRMATGYHRALEEVLGREVPLRLPDEGDEPADFGPEAPAPADPMYGVLGQAIAELGLGGHDLTLRRVAGAAVELGVGRQVEAAGSHLMRTRREGKRSARS